MKQKARQAHSCLQGLSPVVLSGRAPGGGGRAAGCPCLAPPPLGKKLQLGCQTHPSVGLGCKVSQELGQGFPHLSGTGGFRCSSRPRRATAHLDTPHSSGTPEGRLWPLPVHLREHPGR